MATKWSIILIALCGGLFLFACSAPTPSGEVNATSAAVVQTTQVPEISASVEQPSAEEVQTQSPINKTTEIPLIFPTETPSPTPESHVTEENGVLRSDRKHTAVPEVSAEELNLLVKGNNSFAFDLYPLLQPTGENFFYSPYNISLTLAMLYGGARGDTAQQMADVLHFKPLGEKIHETFFALESALLGREKDALGNPGFILQFANSLWVQKGRPFQETYIDLLAENYFADLHLADFASQPDRAREDINHWVEQKTEGKIPSLFPENSITLNTRLVLANAVYFKSNWEVPFNPELTKLDDFFMFVGQTKVPMMEQTATYRYMRTVSYKVVEIPYHGEGLAMVVFMPIDEQASKYEEAFKDFESKFSLETMNEIVDKLEPQLINLYFPKFKIESEYMLSQTLMKMGILSAFAPMAANFSAIDGTRELYLQQMAHKTYIQVDENGTEAAAATGAAVGITALEPQEAMVLKINHPFIFVIRDQKTSSLLFMGRVLRPIQ